jgi:hypothetical protein
MGGKSKLKTPKVKKPKAKSWSKKVTIDGIIFDSTMEGDYYLLLKDQKAKGLIKDFKLQPEYVLQEKYTTPYGKKLQDIVYTADFLVTYNDNSQLVIDVKGRIPRDFTIKRKLYEHRYPLPLVLMQYVNDKIGWVNLDEYKKEQARIKRNETRKKNQALKAETATQVSVKGGKCVERAGTRKSSK